MAEAGAGQILYMLVGRVDRIHWQIGGGAWRRVRDDAKSFCLSSCKSGLTSVGQGLGGDILPSAFLSSGLRPTVIKDRLTKEN